ncbi:hypothetical protein EJB05_17029, partial [Eragrostis curvula]
KPVPAAVRLDFFESLGIWPLGQLGDNFQITAGLNSLSHRTSNFTR